MEFKEIIQLIQTVSDSNVNNFKMKDGDFKINISKDVHVSDVRKGTIQYGINEGGLPAPQIAVNVPVPRQETMAAATKQPVDGNIVKCPLVGTFYASPSPEDAPYVAVGDTVKKGQVLGIVEAMKLMNDIESEFDGTVVEVLVNNEEVVEYGQPLFVIK